MSYTIEMLWDCPRLRHAIASESGAWRSTAPDVEFPKTRRATSISLTTSPRQVPSKAKRTVRLARVPTGSASIADRSSRRTTTAAPEFGCDKQSGKREWTADVAEVTEQGDRRSVSRTQERVGTPVGKSPGEPEEAGGAPYRSAPSRPTYEPFRGRLDCASATSWPKILIGIGVVGMLALGLWLALRTRIVQATVTDVSWECRVQIDRWQVFHRDGWTPDSQAFDVRDEGQRIHHYDKVATGTHQDPYTESYSCGQTCRSVSIPRTCRSNKNGTATCSGGGSRQSCSPKTCTRTAYRTVTDYKDVPAYRQWHSWNVWDWGFNRTVRHAGHDLDPTWPGEDELVVSLADGEKERRRTEQDMHVVFLDDSAEHHDYEPAGLDEFKTFPIGRRCRLKVGLARGVQVLP